MSLALLYVIATHPSYGIFWAYVMVTYIFVLMRSKEALIAAIIFMAITFYLISEHFPFQVLTRIYATLLIVALFGAVYSFLVDRLLEKVNSLIIHDPLTGALNRNVFQTSVKAALCAHQRYGTSASLFIFDLDHFKSINDNFGHLAGDDVLQSIASLVQQRLRASDQLFRFGGEEFAILLTETSQEQANLLAEEIRELIEHHDFQSVGKVTISGGLSQVRESDETSQWIERCDKALYRAKNAGRNKILTAGEQMPVSS